MFNKLAFNSASGCFSFWWVLRGSQWGSVYRTELKRSHFSHQNNAIWLSDASRGLIFPVLVWGVIFMRVRSWRCRGAHYCTFWSFHLLFWLFLCSAEGLHTVIFRRRGEARFPSVNMFAVKDEVAGDNVLPDVQLQKHENHSKWRHFLWTSLQLSRWHEFLSTGQKYRD